MISIVALHGIYDAPAPFAAANRSCFKVYKDFDCLLVLL